ncbi:MAG: M24 family metallopeptidase, partial [Acidimicrobiia bacterium]
MSYASRVARARARMDELDVDVLLLSVGADLPYLTGYEAMPLERLTMLVLPRVGDAQLLVPRLEAPRVEPQPDVFEIVAWDETDDPVRMVQTLVGSATRVGVQDQMWARFALRLQAALDPAQLVAAGATMSSLRRVKSADEIDRLRAAAAAADEAMLAITGQRLSGRTEAEVSRHVRELLIGAGHDDARFSIVASGPNSASPHHVSGERTIEPGDAIVLDIGGSRAGYSSDTSRSAFVGEPPAEFVALFAVLRDAQRAACQAVRPGVPAAEVDAVARDLIADAGYDDAFLHRTGHGIGME